MRRSVGRPILGRYPRRRHRYRRGQKMTGSSFTFQGVSRGKIAAALMLFALIGMIVFSFARFTPVVKTLALSRANTIGTRAINEAILSVMKSEEVDYSDLVVLRYDEEGRITALTSNIQEINSFKSLVSMAISDTLSNMDVSEISVPLGNVINGTLLSGRGPRIPVRLVPVGAVSVQVRNEFNSAGINQTHHEIMLDVTALIKIVMPGSSVSTEISTTMSIAENVIVGDVPQTYTHVTGDDSDTLEKINNYT